MRKHKYVTLGGPSVENYADCGRIAGADLLEQINRGGVTPEKAREAVLTACEQMRASGSSLAKVEAWCEGFSEAMTVGNPTDDIREILNRALGRKSA